MKLAAYLKSKNVSKAEFARQTGISEGTISLLCADKVWLSKGKARKILEATDGEVTPTDFLAESAQPERVAS